MVNHVIDYRLDAALIAALLLTLTTLMTRLILDHADGADRQRKEAGHDA